MLSTLMIDRIASSGSQIVAMMKTAKSRHRDNLAGSLGLSGSFTTGWCSLSEPEMRSVVVIVADILIHQAF